MAVGDIYKVLINGSTPTQAIKNRFYYSHEVGSAGNDNAEGLYLALLADLLPAIGDALQQTYFMDSVHVINLIAPIDQHLGTPGIAGQQVGQGMATHVTLSVTLNPANPVLRAGGKRFSPIREDDFNGQIVDTTYNSTKLTPLLQALADPQVFSGNTWVPNIGSVISETPLTGVFTPVQSASYLGVTSQNSRKFYTNPGF